MTADKPGPGAQGAVPSQKGTCHLPGPARIQRERSLPPYSDAASRACTKPGQQRASVQDPGSADALKAMTPGESEPVRMGSGDWTAVASVLAVVVALLALHTARRTWHITRAVVVRPPLFV